ncbi:MAG: SPOR domain-containing protein [Rhizobiaceae bacterium]|nr:SPOR domain-containing protein [Rhizobiaceae bacterium]
MAVLGGSVITLALLGTVGFFAWNNAGDRNLAESGGPLLIKADAEPYKMVPKDPGGRSIPNQNKAVYERVASPGIEPTPTQSALLTDSEEPMDLPVEEEVAAYDDLPGVDLADNEGLGFKDEARIEEGALPFADSAPIPVLQPRKVRTMIVRSDGTIVQSEPAAAPPAMAAAAVATPIVMADAVPRPVAEQPVVNGAPALIEASSSVPRPQEVPFSSALVEELAPAQITAPEPTAGAVPGLPTQVADPVEVASIAPRPAEAPAPPAASAVAALVAGGYFVQISSQPSEALAQASLQTLGSRFASVIEGRSIGIQSADIPGKGTFYRVRVATASKDEAATLCNRLKSAGGNCFVAR